MTPSAMTITPIAENFPLIFRIGATNFGKPAPQEMQVVASFWFSW
jgi:hypothetical protein